MSRIVWLFLMLAVTAALFDHQARADPKSDDDDDYANDHEEIDDLDEDEEEETYTGPPPVIHSRPRELSLKPGETVRLPCEVENADRVVLLWTMNNHSLWTDDIRVTNNMRITKQADNTLEIKKLQPTDAGSYRCTVTGTETHTLHVTHTLHILMTPRIIKLTPGPGKKIHKGQPLTLECNATGYPVPAVSWSRKGKNLPDGEEMVQGSSITFNSVTRKHAGVYECMASNNIGEPATASVAVTVEYSPEIEIEKEIVNSGEGYDAELVCEVHAEPKAKVVWSKDGKPVRNSDRVTVTHQGNRHILQVQNTEKSDFGNYTCHADNSLGPFTRVIRLSGEPSPPTFVSEEEMERDVTLEWKVESHSPITSYELRYRNRQSSDWKTVHPMVENPEGNVYTVSHVLKGLSSGQYEVIVLAQNTYGWSNPSIAHNFELKPSMGDTSVAAAAQSPLLALLTILSLSTFFL